MECPCEIDVDIDYGLSESLADEKRKAQKPHKCNECGGDICPGDTYAYYKGIYEGDIFTNKTCLDCLSIRETFFAGYYYFGQILEDFHEFINETQGQIAEDCIAGLTSKSQDMVCAAIDNIWQEYWLEHPTQFAIRLELKMRELELWKRPGWMSYRNKEIILMDNAVLM